MAETQSNKLLVIGAGLPRTGTLSLSNALETLFGGKCYHMKPYLEKGSDYDTKHWHDALVCIKFPTYFGNIKFETSDRRPTKEVNHCPKKDGLDSWKREDSSLQLTTQYHFTLR